MDIATALVLLLIVGLIYWLLPIPGIVLAVAVVLILVGALLPYARRSRLP